MCERVHVYVCCFHAPTCECVRTFVKHACTSAPCVCCVCLSKNIHLWISDFRVSCLPVVRLSASRIQVRLSIHYSNTKLVSSPLHACHSFAKTLSLTKKRTSARPHSEHLLLYIILSRRRKAVCVRWRLHLGWLYSQRQLQRRHYVHVDNKDMQKAQHRRRKWRIYGRYIHNCTYIHTQVYVSYTWKHAYNLTCTQTNAQCLFQTSIHLRRALLTPTKALMTCLAGVAPAARYNRPGYFPGNIVSACAAEHFRATQLYYDMWGPTYGDSFYECLPKFIQSTPSPASTTALSVGSSDFYLPCANGNNMLRCQNINKMCATFFLSSKIDIRVKQARLLLCLLVRWRRLLSLTHPPQRAQHQLLAKPPPLSALIRQRASPPLHLGKLQRRPMAQPSSLLRALLLHEFTWLYSSAFWQCFLQWYSEFALIYHNKSVDHQNRKHGFISSKTTRVVESELFLFLLNHHPSQLLTTAMFFYVWEPVSNW